MDCRALIGLFAAAASALSIAAEAAPRPRGPKPPVVRPAAKTFPLRATTEIKGSVASPEVVAAAWSGPGLLTDEAVPAAQREWMQTSQTAWERLRIAQDAAFAAAFAEEAQRK